LTAALLPMASVLLMAAAPAQAQEQIYRCGNEYTNNAEVAKSRGCKPIEGGNITVIQSPKPRANPVVNNGSPRAAAPRNDSAEQRARDSDARQILQNELRRAEERLVQTREAYANGEPPKEGIESRNHQRYLDRVQGLKEAMHRAQSDVESIRNELSRLGGASAGGGAASASGAAPGARAAQ
jgi:hypothetical protein